MKNDAYEVSHFSFLKQNSRRDSLKMLLYKKVRIDQLKIMKNLFKNVVFDESLSL